jgi:hypothetical protein
VPLLSEPHFKSMRRSPEGHHFHDEVARSIQICRRVVASCCVYHLVFKDGPCIWHESSVESLCDSAHLASLRYPFRFLASPLVRHAKRAASRNSSRRCAIVRLQAKFAVLSTHSYPITPQGAEEQWQSAPYSLD